MTVPLRVDLTSHHPVVLLAAAELARAWRLVTTGLIHITSTRADVTLGLGSVIRPSVIVQLPSPFAGEPARRAHLLALTSVAWSGLTEREPWRDVSAPLGPWPRLGVAIPDRDWALSLHPARRPGAQVHVLSNLPTRMHGDGVWWPKLPAIAAALLGHASLVLGRSSPLVLDAVRAGVPAPELAITGASLAGLVPPALLSEHDLWNTVAEQARALRGSLHPPEPLLTPAWVDRARERARRARANPSTWARQRRKLAKLRRDPKAFFRDSRISLLKPFAERSDRPSCPPSKRVV